MVRCPSVTPADAGALDVLVGALEPLGFTCHRLRFDEDGTPPIDNLYARLGGAGPNLCFAGHTDVVPPGDPRDWTADPFAGDIIDGKLHGRGTSDMKAAIAAFVAAAARRIAAKGAPAGSISLLITGDEEGPAINGTRKVLDWLVEKGETLDACVVGEPTNPNYLGEMIKVGRRGSITGHLTVHGTQGHVAYPHLADNPLPRLVRMLAALTAEPLDQGNAHFQPSTLAITTIDVGNPADNVIPAKGTASFNIRFNDEHTSDRLKDWIKRTCDTVGGPYDLKFRVSGESFLTPPGALSALVADAVERVTGHRPELSTTGGTSDARFIKAHCPVVEFGIVGQTMHKVDEHVAVADVERLTDIYEAVIDGFFAPTGGTAA
ncbi:succinyl-diaminopimelate desuccinylase [Skermanella stibiiresistens SB22]|uniref:Succinyl-diaminopimelate desuccinylase n=1 Tax=Skermanella stibiiresistens SB22 TaxID=1385369 RepID=W9H9C8_9PROT|nr:succinyl-diaminopimelate desuccinylase [Skermanella stibiiresistens SB22]